MHKGFQVGVRARQKHGLCGYDSAFSLHKIVMKVFSWFYFFSQLHSLPITLHQSLHYLNTFCYFFHTGESMNVQQLHYAPNNYKMYFLTNVGLACWVLGRGGGVYRTQNSFTSSPTMPS